MPVLSFFKPTGTVEKTEPDFAKNRERLERETTAFKEDLVNLSSNINRFLQSDKLKPTSAPAYKAVAEHVKETSLKGVISLENEIFNPESVVTAAKEAGPGPRKF